MHEGGATYLEIEIRNKVAITRRLLWFTILIALRSCYKLTVKAAHAYSPCAVIEFDP